MVLAAQAHFAAAVKGLQSMGNLNKIDGSIAGVVPLEDAVLNEQVCGVEGRVRRRERLWWQ